MNLGGMGQPTAELPVEVNGGGEHAEAGKKPAEAWEMTEEQLAGDWQTGRWLDLHQMWLEWMMALAQYC